VMFHAKLSVLSLRMVCLINVVYYGKEMFK
jgi:hypothetical protein